PLTGVLGGVDLDDLQLVLTDGRVDPLSARPVSRQDESSQRQCGDGTYRHTTLGTSGHPCPLSRFLATRQRAHAHFPEPCTLWTSDVRANRAGGVARPR